MVDTGEVENRGEQIKAFWAEGTAHTNTSSFRMPGHSAFFEKGKKGFVVTEAWVAWGKHSGWQGQRSLMVKSWMLS